MDLSQRLNTVVNTGVEDPALAFALANSDSSDDDLVKVGQMYNGFQLVQHQIDALSKQSKADQDQVWQSLDGATQELYKRHGYQPVIYEDKSILRKVTKGIGAVTGPISRAVGLHEIPAGMEALGRGATQAYRYGRELGTQVLFDNEGDSLSEIWELWSRVGQGEQYYNEDVRTELKGILPEGLSDYAIGLSAGMTPSEYLESKGHRRNDPDWSANLVALYGAQGDERLVNAVNFLADHKISFGRDIRSLATADSPIGMNNFASQQELIRGNVPIGGPIPIIKNIGRGDFISGSADALYAFKTDPTLLAGKVSKGWRVAKYGLDPSDSNKFIDDIDLIQNNWEKFKAGELSNYAAPTRYGHAAERIAHYAANDDWAGLAREMPQMMHGMDALKAAGVKSVDDVFNFYKTTEGINIIARGRFGRGSFPTGTGKLFLPTANVFTPVGGKVKNAVEVIIDKGRFTNATQDLLRVGEGLFTPGQVEDRILEIDNIFNAGGPNLTSELADTLTGELNQLRAAKEAGTEAVTAPVQRAKWNPARMSADLLHGFTSMVPKNSVMDPHSPEASEYIMQLFKFHLPKGIRDDMFNAFMTAPNMTWKKLEYESAMKLMSTTSGIGNTAKGQSFLTRFLGRLNQSYAVGGIDRMLLPNGDQVRAGIWPDQMAGAWQFPTFKDWYNVSRDMGNFHQTTQNVIDTIHSQMWKPSVLLRVGFIPRAFGEELVWGIAHFGTGAVYRGHLMAIAAKGEAEPLLAVRPILRMSRTLNTLTQGSIVNKPVSAIDTLVEFGANATTRWVRKGAYNLLPGEGAPVNYKGAIRHLMQNQPTAQTAFGEGFSAVNQFGMGPALDDTNLIFAVQRKTDDGGYADVYLKMDQFDEVGPTLEVPDAPPVSTSVFGEYQIMAHWNQYGDDDPIRNLVRSAGAQWLYPNEMDEVAAKAVEFGLDVTKQDLYKLVPENMPARWDQWLKEENPDTLFKFSPESAALLPTGTEAFIKSLPARQRYALFSRNTVLDRHVASQELTQGRRLLDPQDLPDELIEETQDVFRAAMDDDMHSAYVQQLASFQDSGYEGLPAVIDAATAAGMPEEDLTQLVKELYTGWMRQGYEGVLDQTGKAKLWDSTGRAVRDVVAQGERTVWHDFYKAMADGDKAKGEEIVTSMLASRYGRGDLERKLSVSDQVNIGPGGIPLATPVPEGMHRVYTITVPHSAAEATPGLKVDPQMVDTDLAFHAMAGDQAIEFGIPGIPGQAWFTADYQQAKRLQRDMNARFVTDTQPGQPAGHVSVGYLDMPTDDFNKGRALARDEISGGLAPTADTRQLATVFVGPEYKSAIHPVDNTARELAPYNGELRPVEDLKARMKELEVLEQEPPNILPGEMTWEEVAEETEASFGSLGEAANDGVTMIESRPGTRLTERVYIYWDEDGLPASMLSMNMVDGQAAGFSVATRPDMRRKGLATRLYREAEKDGVQGVEAASGATGFTEAGAAFRAGRRQKEMAALQKAINEGAAINGIDRGTNLENLARKNLQDFKNSFSNPFDPEDQRDLRDILFALEKKGDVGLEDWDGITAGHLPKTLSVPRLVEPRDSNILQRGTEKGFEWIGRAGNTIIRQPLFHHLYAQSLSDIGPLIRSSLIDDALDARITTMASKYGMSRDQLLDEWNALPDYIRTAANPAEMAEITGDVDAVGALLLQLDPNDAAKLNTAVDHLQHVERVVSDSVSERAMNGVIPYLDDHRLRSQFQEKHRWMFPFWFAEEQFVKRWARTIRQSPEVIRKAALVMQGMRHVGIITQNEYGEDVYNFPGSELVLAAISRGVETLTGRPAMMPFANPFTGAVKYSAPGLDRFGVPSAGPVVGLSLSLIQRIFPELNDNPLVQGFEELPFIYGKEGLNRTIAQQLIPASFLTMYNAVTGSTEGTPQMASALAESMAYMEANGLAPQPRMDENGVMQPPDDDEVQIYRDRLENWSRLILLTRGALQFVTPATPMPETPMNFNAEFKELLRELPMEDALGIFLDRHPDAEPWTIFDTKSVSGAPLPATDEAYKVMDSNEGFFSKYQNASPWFLPQSAEDDEFSREAYYYQLAHGYRVRKGADEYWRDIKFAQSAETYFRNKEKTDAALASTKGNTEATESIRNKWKSWKDEYFRLNPVFAAELRSPEASERRKKTLTQMTQALANPERPNVPHLVHIEKVVNNWNGLQGALKSWEGDNSRAGQLAKKSAKEKFALWGQAYTRENAEVKAFWDRVIRPELGLAELEEER